MAGTRSGGARWAGLLGLARAVRAAQRPDGPSMSDQVAAVPRLISAVADGSYRGMSRGRLLAVALGVLYVISPVDMMPEGLLLMFGMVDDAAIAFLVGGWLLNETDRFLSWENSRAASAEAAVLPS